ncbi:allantoate amidohydrolase [Rosenbergiella australiborealis]|uniref:Allantoate amidohydrolase n=1 Tax=Rosenbergiella australiborealis TaxID=1544696 RepID=A0ABS5T7P1_9GAMM|nr:allantoate amidohydrolase [Rosenbergiella australiborealis]MBT0728381.1 allantoate amidohydrolase [Rosenbergiella australiborealis]
MHNLIPHAMAASAAQRVMQRCDHLASFSETEGELTRVYLSEQHFQANRQVQQWMEEAGMSVWQDEVGNICGRYEAATEGAPAILLGSHLDSVRNAGRYDGPLGVLTAIEVVSWLHQHHHRLANAIEIVGFADEEGTRFGITLLGSKGITGQWPDDWLEKTDHRSISVRDAMIAQSLNPLMVHQAARSPESIAAYLELHIEQGPCLEAADLPLGVVTAINGAHRLNCQFIGLAGHAGTVPMSQRQDALAAAAHWMVAIEKETAAAGGGLVATVGQISCSPGAVNVIPGSVALSLDIRGPEDGPLRDLLAQLLAKAEQIAAERGITFNAEEFYHIPATACDKRLRDACTQAVTAVQGSAPQLSSGAGHDAIAIAAKWPVGMIFVRCEKGISHHPAEAVTASDVAAGIQAFTQAVQLTAAPDTEIKSYALSQAV